MNLILITGKSGSGKSTFAKLLAQKLGYKYIDVDKIVHKLYEHEIVIQKVKELFGDEVFDNNNMFNRKKLGNIFFNEKSKRVLDYTEFTYNIVSKEIDLLLNQDAVIDYILLPQTKYWNQKCAKILVKSVNDEQRFCMLQKRDNITTDYIKKRETASIDYNDSDFDFIIQNDYNLKNMENKVEEIFNCLNKKLKE
ncbi:MAG: dephospho-CoA kinase [Clostridia bacterium]|nr:dephospho-CoA kinase [Clostridia bacterium]